MSGDGTHVIKLGNYWRITNVPLRSWIAPMYQQSIEQATALYKLDQQRFGRSGNIIICTFKLRLDVWFFPSDSACISRPSSACCLCSTLCMHYMHAHTHALQSSVIGHLRPGHNTIVYTKSVSCTYILLLRGQLFFLYHGESVYISHVNCLLFLVCCIHNAVIRCNFLCAPPGLPCEVLHSL